MNSSQLADTDAALGALGDVPPDVNALVSRQLGRARITLQDADQLLSELAQGGRVPVAGITRTPEPARSELQPDAAAREMAPIAPTRAASPLGAAERPGHARSMEAPASGPLAIGRPPPAASAVKPAVVAAQLIADVVRSTVNEAVAVRSRADTRDLGQSVRPRPRPSIPDPGPVPSSRPRVETRDFGDMTPTSTRPHADALDFADGTPTRPRVPTRDFGESRPPLPRFELKEQAEVVPVRARADTRDLLSPNSRRPPLAKGLAGIDDLPELPDLPRGRLGGSAPRASDETKAASKRAPQPDTSSFEILVDEEILELDADDTIIEEDDL